MVLFHVFGNIPVDRDKLISMVTTDGHYYRLTSSGQEWQISSFLLTSSGQEWQFHIPTDI